MSIAVTLDELPARMSDFEDALFVTVSAELRPHVVSIRPSWRDTDLMLVVGHSSIAHLAERPDVTLCFPARDADGPSLIVDGRASHDGGDVVRFEPTHAILHRPAPAKDDR